MKKIPNPFVVGKYVSNEYFCDRVEETKFLRKQVLNGRNTALISQRRIGKTELIQHFFNQEDIQNQYYTFFVDIYSTSSLAEFVYLFGKTIYKQLKPQNILFREKFFQIITSLRAGFKLDSITGEPTFDIGLANIEKPLITLEEIFSYLESADKPCIVAIDEFQQITNYDEKNVEALLRTHIQKTTNAFFIFSGSKSHIMSQIFQSSSKPFYQSAILFNLQQINKKNYVDFAVNLFKNYNKNIDNQLVAEIYDRYFGITLFVQMMMNELFVLTNEGEECLQENVLLAEKNIIRVQEIGYKEIMNHIPSKQKFILIAIAKEKFSKNILSSSFIKKHNLSSSSSVQAAMKGLLEKDIVTQTENGYCVYDCFFAEWLRENY